MADRIRILVVSQPTITGAALHVLDLARRLDRSRYEVTVASPISGWLRDAVEKVGCRHIPLALHREIRWMDDLKAAIALLRLIQQVKPDILHLHASKAGFLGRVLRPIHRLNVVIYTPHGLAYRQFKGWRRTFFLALERFAALFGDQIVCVSDSERQDAIRDKIDHQGKLTTIMNGVEIPEAPRAGRGRLRKVLDLSEGSLVLAMLARLEHPKQPKDLIRAIAILHKNFNRGSFHTVFFGDGSLETESRREADLLRIEDCVTFMGFHPDVVKYLPDIDIVILASTVEGMPYSLLEGMASGKVLVGTRSPGITDIIRPGVNGYVYSSGNHEELADVLGNLIKDVQLRERLGANGRALVAKSFRADQMVRATTHLYENLLDAI